MKNLFRKKENTFAIRERYGEIVHCSFFDDEISLIKCGVLDENLFQNEDYQKLLKKKKLSFVVDKDVSLDSEKMKKVLEIAKGCHVMINLGTEEVYSAEELKKLKENFKVAEEYGPKLEFVDGFTIKQAEKASNYIEGVVNNINQMEVDGKKLTQFERYMAAYREVTKYSYKFEDEKDSKWKSRNLNFVLGNDKVDKIVCVGYAAMLKAICDRVGVPCSTLSVQTDFDESYIDEKGHMDTNHQMCQVRLNDKEAGVEGVYYADPTNDSKKDPDKETSIRFSLIKERDLEHIYGNSSCVKANENDYRRYAELYKDEKAAMRNTTFNMLGKKCVEKINNVTDKFFAPENPDLYLREEGRDDEKIKTSTEWVGSVLGMQIGTLKERENIIQQLETFEPDISEEIILYCLKNNNISKKEFITKVFGVTGEEVKKAVDSKFNNIVFFNNLSKERYEQVKNKAKDVESNKMCMALDKINRAEGMTKEESENKIAGIIKSSYEVSDASVYRPIDLRVFDMENYKAYNRDPSDEQFKDLVHGYINGEKGLYQQYYENEQKKEAQGIEKDFKM